MKLVKIKPFGGFYLPEDREYLYDDDCARWININSITTIIYNPKTCCCKSHYSITLATGHGYKCYSLP